MEQLKDAVPSCRRSKAKKRITPGLLFSASLHRSHEILSHIAGLYSLKPSCVDPRVQPVIHSDVEASCARDAWADHENSFVIDGVRHFAAAEIRNMITSNAAFRIYNEYDLETIKAAFMEESIDEKTDLKGITVLLPSSATSTRDGDDHSGDVRVSSDDGGEVGMLLSKIREIMDKNDIHFKVATLLFFSFQCFSSRISDPPSAPQPTNRDQALTANLSFVFKQEAT